MEKRDRIKRKPLLGNTKQGDIGVVDIESKAKSIKCSWILKLTSYEQNNIKIFLEKEYDISNILRTNKLDTWNHRILKRFPIFYREILEIFNETKYSSEIDKMTTYDFLKQPVWGKKIFQYKNEPNFFENCLNVGIFYVKDLVIENGVKPLYHFSKILSKKHNIYCEYLVIKNVFQNLKKQLD